MKKIFLTSGIIVCMACPAFADPTPIAVDSNNATNANCTETYLGTEADGATVYLEPEWSAYRYNVIYNYGDHGTTTGTFYSDTILAADNSDQVAGGAAYDQPYTMPSGLTNPTAATGYTFRGWSTSSSATATYDSSNDTYTVSDAFVPSTYFRPDNAGASLADNETANIYAIYSANRHTISFNCGTATAISNTTIPSIDVTYGVAIGENSSTRDATYLADYCTPAENYHFAGWTCTNGITGSSFASTDTYDYDTDTTCTANWSADTINLIWYASDDQNSTTTAATNDCTVGGGLTLPQQPEARNGYNFKGWKVTTVRQ